MATAELRTKSSIEKTSVKRQSSLVPSPPASAFGDDDEDYRRVTKQQSDAEKERQKKERESLGTNFGKATFSRAPKVLDGVNLQEVLETERKGSVILQDGNGNQDDAGSSENSTDHSEKQSDEEPGHVTDPSGSWKTFAHTKFQVRASHSYCCAPLPMPLMMKRDKADHLASLAAWATILRIMGDLPEVDFGDSITVQGQSKPITEKVRENFQRKYTKKDVEDAHKKYTDLFKDPVATEIKNVPFLQDNCESMLEKVQYVTALGIYKSDLRDELYCQVCKQLTNNPSRNSTIRGWVLLFIFAGSFCPTEKFAPCFLQFLKDGPTEHAQRVERLLRRTFTVGTRGQPPSWLEFQAAKNGKPILVPVILMNGTRFLMDADTATTVNELSAMIAQRAGVQDRSGFSIYITMGQRIACLGHGLHRVMDAIAECEQFTKDQGMKESSSTWRIFFRKEFFTPWYDPGSDWKGTDLTYQQIMRGVSVGEYKCEKENVLVMMAAQRYYIDHSTDTTASKLEKFLSTWFPKEEREKQETAYWVEKIKTEIDNDFLKDAPNKQSLKADIVTFAMNKWYNLFSRFYDTSKVQGPGVSWNNVILGVNCKGFNIMDESENVKVRLSFIEITQISRMKHAVTVSTIQGDDYIATTHHSDDLYTLLTSFQVGLRQRSRYALAVQDASHFESAIGFGLAKGDLIKFDKPYNEYGDSDVYTGTSLSNNKHGGIPRDVLYILPTTEEPSASILGMLAVQTRKDTSLLVPSRTSIPVPEHGPEGHTLQAYAKMHFRSSTESTMNKFFSKTSLKKKDREALWRFSKEVMKKPLMRRTNMRDDLRKAACRSFLAIQKYMGDSAHKDNISDTDMVNECIIDVAIRNKYLRDELFCQVIKQLTYNPNKLSEERGWQLLWLLLSSTYPLSELYEELEFFLSTNPNVLAKRCLTRLHVTKSQGCRYTAPHELEHEALLTHASVIEFNVMFPDQTHQKMDVSSSTRLSDIHNTICHKLQLSRPDQYGLFFGLKDKVINVPDSDYFFDYLSHIQRFYMRQSRTASATEAMKSAAPPILIFMKKLWMHATPGQDKLADIKFHFPQEIPNYLRGYHKCSPEDAVTLGALVFRARHGNDKKAMDSLLAQLPSLIPKTVLQLRALEDWKKLLEAEIATLKFPSKEDAMVAFLKALQKWPTFGAVFFEVKQRTTKTYPKNLLVCVNSSGVGFVDDETKEVLVMNSFDKIPNWAFDEYSFTLVIGEGTGLTKLYMDTSVGRNMDDLIMAYVGYIMNTQIKKKPTYAGIVVGESMC